MEAKKPLSPSTTEEGKFEPGPDHLPNPSCGSEPDPDNSFDPEERPFNPFPNVLLLPAELVTPQKQLPLLHVCVWVMVVKRVTHLAPSEYRAQTHLVHRHTQLREREKIEKLEGFGILFDFYI